MQNNSNRRIGYLAHHERESGGDEREEDQHRQRRPAFGERGEMWPHDPGCEEQKGKIDRQEQPEGVAIRDQRERGKRQRSERRSKERERCGHRCDELVLEEFLGREIVQERRLPGAEHVAGGVVDPEIDRAGAHRGAEAETGGDLHQEQAGEVELEAFSGEKHRWSLR